MSITSPLASLYSVLQTVRASAEANAPLLRKNEAATRAALIDPVLRALGWDTANVQMVEPERTIGSELRVDYLLHDATGKPRLVVEAKCLGASLDKHGYVSKVLGYALGFKVQTVFITDGLNWHCYSNLHKGNTDAITFSLSEVDLLSASIQLIQWLDAAQSGHGIILPKPPDVKTSDAPSKPLPIQAQGEETSNYKEVSSKTFADDFIELASVNSLQLKPEQKPKQLRLPDGSIKAIKSWRDILVETCRFVLDNNPVISMPFPDKAGKTRVLIGENKPKGLFSTLINYQGKPVFIYTHYRSSNCVANAIHALTLVPHSLKKVSAGVLF